METVFHTPIKIETICKNGSEKFGAKASCHFWQPETPKRKIEVSQHGETKAIAKEKLLRFLSNSGENNLKEEELIP